VDDIRALAREMGASIVSAYKMDSTKAVLAAAAPGAEAPAGAPAAAVAAAASAAGEAAGCSGQGSEAAASTDVQAAAPGSPAPLMRLPSSLSDSMGGTRTSPPAPQHDAGSEERPLSPPPSPSGSTSSRLSATAAVFTPRAALVPAAAPVAGWSAKAQQRHSRRVAAMAQRGLTPPISELRRMGVVSGPTCSGFPPESFDSLLLDAPCTAMGLRPRLLQPLTYNDVRQAEAYQRLLIAAAVQLLKPGGCMVFSTCSVNPGGRV
jgi:hypothetical protein